MNTENDNVLVGPLKLRSNAISTVTAALFIVGILVVALAAGLTILSINHGNSPTSSSSTLSQNSSNSTTSPINSSIITSEFFNFSSTTTSSTRAPSPNITYIGTNNTGDSFGTSIYSALDNNTGEYGWVFETGYQDSVLGISNNQVASHIAKFSPDTPTGIAFDSKNNLTYAIYGIPSGCNLCGYGLSAISKNNVVSTPLSNNLQGWPAAISYDQHYDLLYIIYAVHGVNTKQGIAVFDPNNGTQLAYISSSGASSGNIASAYFTYDPVNGDMFVALSFTGGGPSSTGTTVYDLRGETVVSSLGFQNIIATGTSFNPSDGYLYVSEQQGGILVINTTNQSSIGRINSSYQYTSMIYDTSTGNIYAFFASGTAGGVQAISGTATISNSSTPYIVDSSLYNPRFNKILAFF